MGCGADLFVSEFNLVGLGLRGMQVGQGRGWGRGGHGRGRQILVELRYPPLLVSVTLTAAASARGACRVGVIGACCRGGGVGREGSVLSANTAEDIEDLLSTDYSNILGGDL